MSFASEAKAELCAARIHKKCCALAESYGILLYANTFSAREIRVITASADLALRLPRLFRRAFGLEFDRVPPEGSGGKQSFLITEPDKLRRIFNAFGVEPESTLIHHVNYGVLEEDCCRLSFLRGAFLAGGSASDPEKGFHLELATPHHSVSRETCSLLLDMGFEPKEARRGGNALLYFKKADVIADLLTALGATRASMAVQTAKVDKEMRNTITRRVNCDSANADKVVSAAQEQLDAIRRIVKEYGLDALPEPLKDTALLRIANPEASLADLARLSYPPVSKSCLSHRLKKIMSLTPEGPAETDARTGAGDAV
ncbi:MAG: DNA-binding protein WhiA [Oscillospiraceae bacterium]|nr:DNA-binding protein WhiA [Oscillospiraceae bacterium]